jgi:3-oxoadipate enol-lactonase
MRTVTSDDAELRVEHTPRPGAPALLLLNAIGTTLEMWDDQVDAFSERYELIRFDTRGHGGSTTGTAQEYTIDRLARDAIAVLDGCGIARAHLCGLSLGGMVSMHLATRWPDRVLKATLCNTSPYMPPRETWETRIQTVKRDGMAALAEGILQRWFTQDFHRDHPDEVDRIRRMLLDANPTGYAACLAAIRDMDQRETIRSITSTTLVIGGKEDPGTTPADAELIALSIPGATLKLLDCAHLSNVERAAEFNATVLEFLAA